MTPDNPCYYDPREPSSIGLGLYRGPVEESGYIDAAKRCSECGEYCDGHFEIDYFRVDGEFFCEPCYSDLPVCGDGDHRFTGEPIRVPGFDEVFCSEEHAQFAKEEW